jgi:hypothetical protein
VRAGVPEVDRAVVGGTGEDVLVGREQHLGAAFLMFVEFEFALGVEGRPEVDERVVAARGQVLPEVGRVGTCRS